MTLGPLARAGTAAACVPGDCDQVTERARRTWHRVTTVLRPRPRWTDDQACVRPPRRLWHRVTPVLRPRPRWTDAHASVAPPRRHCRYASMNGSRSPSSTAVTFPVSYSDRRSFPLWYAWST